MLTKFNEKSIDCCKYDDDQIGKLTNEFIDAWIARCKELQDTLNKTNQ